MDIENMSRKEKIKYHTDKQLNHLKTMNKMWEYYFNKTKENNKWLLLKEVKEI